jgi:hypothetical protein
MRVTLRWLVCAACVAAAWLLVAGQAGAATARNCNPPTYPSSGYFNRITVTGASCATGNKVAIAYYHCRTRSGNLAGRCSGGVLGYHCTEVRNAISTEIDARVTCRRGRVKVVHVYTQHLAG